MEPDPLVNPLAHRAEKLTLILEVARSMATLRDLEQLLALILEAATKVAEADRCSLFLVDRERGELWTRLAHGVDAGKEIRIPLGSGIAGSVAVSGKAINLTQAYDDPRFNRAVDQATGYRTGSLLTVPMTIAGGAHHAVPEETVVGVLQVLNRRDGAPFTDGDQELLEGLGALAAAAIENTVLSAEIQRLFEGFVQASVGAIEARDPTTRGHSERVASLSVGLAETLVRVRDGRYAGQTFTPEALRQLRYAALLHDFGKVGVREHVLIKANKLFPHELAAVEGRFELIRRSLELSSARRQLVLSAPAGRAAVVGELVEEERALAQKLLELDEALAFVRACNQPNILSVGDYGKLKEYQALAYVTPEGSKASYLTTDEVERLSIARGSLSEDERREIESHVVHTFEFLRRIPWTRDLRRVPEIAHGHHEKLDGTGYPLRLDGGHILLETRMMTIADIFDALTASDRPYKKAVPYAKAVAILEAEAARGILDRELLTIFLESQVPKRVLGLG